ncbi:MAG TPA: cytochrome c [Bryobacteraceae bacterium]|nr:cytochrome c [Bryobacteraceae bacterium]
MPRLHGRDAIPVVSILAVCCILAANPGSAQDKRSGALVAQGARLSRDDAKKLQNPVPYSRKSIGQGRTMFQRYCTNCHGPDGKAQVDVVANATDLTSPADFKSGTTDGEIFRSIRDGAGESMPPFKTQIAEETDLWNLVNFIRSLWPESTRPPLKDQ